MHEMSIAIALIEQVKEEALLHKLHLIDEVEVEAGSLRLVIPDLMRTAFEIVSEGTIAQKARLVITEIEPEARCNQCQRFFVPEIDNFLCPDCHVADVMIIKGDNIILKSIAGSKKESGGVIDQN